MLKTRDRLPPEIPNRDLDVSLQNDIERSACISQKSHPSHGSNDKTGCIESDDGTWDAQKLQGSRINQPGPSVLDASPGIAQQS